jgi:hypothetical protein
LRQWASQATWDTACAAPFGAWPGPRALAGQAIFDSESDFLQGNQPTAITVFFIFHLISLQFKFSLIFYWNLV